ncbi:MAG: class I SAM-dependent RNA methyltransferase, partial [Rhodothermales bacterium]
MTLMYQYQQTQRFFAQIARGMEELGAEELTDLGARNIAPAYRGLYFDADQAALYRINYGSRLVTRVLAPLTAFQCHNPDYLYRTARSVQWTDFMTVDHTFAVFANVSNSKIRHSKYAALRVKDAVVDTFREQCGRRPSVDTRHPHVWINLYIENNRATLSLDTAGGSLHRRGYRQQTGSAPMQETVAAAVIRLSGWQGERPLVDPMCGSGTLLAEALMHYCRIPAGYLRRHFGFEALPDFDETVWAAVRREADEQMRPLPAGLIAGSDASAEAIAAARTNMRTLPYGEHVALSVRAYQDREDLEGVTLISNPPYGIRVGRKETIGDFYK